MDLKRAYDATLATAGFFVTAPVTITALFAMAVINRSSPLFKQTRFGLNQKPFTVLKIKTMIDKVDEDGKLLPDEQRVSRLGKLFRKTGIDELPQLYNVFKGDMGVVGPRPVPEHSSLASDKKRHSVKPGFFAPLGLAGKNRLTTEQILKLDHKYVNSHSLAGDIQVLLSIHKGLVEKLNAPHYRKDTEISSIPSIDS